MFKSNPNKPSTGPTRWLLAIGLFFLAMGCAADLKNMPIILPPPPTVRPPTPVSSVRAGRTLFVDTALSREACDSYAPASRLCHGGSEQAYKTIGLALDNAYAGDTVVIRQGRYNEPVAPVRSGTAGNPITVRGFGNEQVTVGDLDRPAIQLTRCDHIIIEGLSIDNSLGWGRLEESNYNVLRNNRFDRALARGTTGGLKLVRSHYNRIVANSFHRGNDSIVLQESDRNLIDGNRMSWARHSLLSVRCSNFNVIRSNRFHNERQKAMEIYDCEGVSDAPFRLDATKRNLVELNAFTYTRGPSSPHKYNAIQYAGQFGIVRRNLFRDNQGGGINVQVYSQEALNNYGHRIYHNTFYANKCYGFAGSDSPAGRYGNIIVINNLFFKNTDCRDKPVQIGGYASWAVDMINNSEATDPLFLSPESGDYRLSPNSTLIDKGAFLTTATSNGAGMELPVEDVIFFFDGFGIENEKGDMIQLAGSNQRARIVSIDHNNKVLILDRAITWKQNQGVALAYEGNAPDIGAMETGVSSP